jgi:hypothetical protein
LLQALEVSRATVSHFENIYCYWSWNINQEDEEYCRDCDSAASFNSTTHDIPSLTTASSEQSMTSSIVSTKSPTIITGVSITMRRQSEPEFAEREEEEHHQHLLELLQPKLLKFD